MECHLKKNNFVSFFVILFVHLAIYTFIKSYLAYIMDVLTGCGVKDEISRCLSTKFYFPNGYSNDLVSKLIKRKERRFIKREALIGIADELIYEAHLVVHTILYRSYICRTYVQIGDQCLFL